MLATEPISAKWDRTFLGRKDGLCFWLTAYTWKPVYAESKSSLILRCGVSEPSNSSMDRRNMSRSYRAPAAESVTLGGPRKLWGYVSLSRTNDQVRYRFHEDGRGSWGKRTKAILAHSWWQRQGSLKGVLKSHRRRGDTAHRVISWNRCSSPGEWIACRFSLSLVRSAIRLEPSRCFHSSLPHSAFHFHA